MDELKKEEEGTTIVTDPAIPTEAQVVPTDSGAPDLVAEPLPQATTPLTTTPEEVPVYKNKVMIASLLVAVLLLGGAGYYAYLKPTKDTVVATVNGKEIFSTEFNENVALIEQSATLQGANLTDAATQQEIRTQAIDTLINNALIITAAEDAGITASDEEYALKYDELLTQIGGEEALKMRMEEVGLTEARLKNNITERILADEYIASETESVDLTVTDADVEAFIKALNAPEGQLPPIEEIRPQIETEIQNQRQQETITALLEKLRAEATIEKNI